MKLSKEQLINYLVDCKGYSENEVEDYTLGQLKLLIDNKDECIEFNK